MPADCGIRRIGRCGRGPTTRPSPVARQPAFEILLGRPEPCGQRLDAQISVRSFRANRSRACCSPSPILVPASPGNSLSGSFGVAGNGHPDGRECLHRSGGGRRESVLPLASTRRSWAPAARRSRCIPTESNDTGFSAALADQTLVISSTILAAGTAGLDRRRVRRQGGGNGLWNDAVHLHRQTRSGDTSGEPAQRLLVDRRFGSQRRGPSDFAAGALNGGTLSFAAGETSKTVTILSPATPRWKPTNSSRLRCRTRRRALTIGTGSAIGTIRNDDGVAPPCRSGIGFGQRGGQQWHDPSPSR